MKYLSRYSLILVLLIISLNSYSQHWDDVISDSLSSFSYSCVDEKPFYQGGKKILREWFQDNINYPNVLLDSNYQIAFYCEISIDTVGKVIIHRTKCGKLKNYHGENVNTLSQDSVDFILAREITRVMAILPPFQPGRHGGKKRVVDGYFSFKFNPAIPKETSTNGRDPFAMAIFPPDKN